MKIKVIHTRQNFVDQRGGITQVVDDEKLKFRGVLRITSKAGSIRSNHYHKKDYHYLYVESGKCEYSERRADSPSAKVETVTLKPGDVVLSRPGIVHAVRFLKDTVLYAFTTEKRVHDKYEKDTKRVKII